MSQGLPLTFPCCFSLPSLRSFPAVSLSPPFVSLSLPPSPPPSSHQVFIASLVKDRFEKHLIMMEQNGLDRFTYWFVTYIFNYTLYIIVAMVIVVFSLIWQMRLFTQVSLSDPPTLPLSLPPSSPFHPPSLLSFPPSLLSLPPSLLSLPPSLLPYNAIHVGKMFII